MKTEKPSMLTLLANRPSCFNLPLHGSGKKERQTRGILRFGVTVVLVSWLMVCLWVENELQAQGAADANPAQASSSSGDFTFGITGHYRIGRWTAVRVNCAAEIGTDQLAIATIDGDGVRVVYDCPRPNLSGPHAAEAETSGGEALFGYVVPGTEAAPIELQSDNKVLTQARFPELGSPSRGPSAIPVGMTWVVCLGDPLGVDQIGANELLNRDAQIAVSIPQAAQELPDSSLGFHGVDVLMVNANGAPLLQELTVLQRTAITDWIQSGGRVFMTLGESASKLSAAAPWLIDLLPLASSIETIELSPSAIETYTSTQNPLDDFVGARLPKDVGDVLLMGRTSRRISTPMAADYVVGLGRVTVLAADLENEMFAAWPERMDLVQRVTGGVFSIKKSKAIGNGVTAFNDLAGQTRSTLDQFPVKRKFGFAVLALILLALIALIGPLDYLFVNRVFGKPLLGWLTFPIVVLGLSALLAVWSLPSASEAPSNALANSTGATVPGSSGPSDTAADISGIQCNRIEFVDLDVVQKSGSGFAWSFLYSHPANQVDVTVGVGATLEAVAEKITQNVTAPYGTPGPTFGGIQIAGEDARLPPFRVEMTHQNGERRSKIKQLAIAPRSSKSLATQLRLSPKLGDVSSVTRRRGSELLEGKLTNPLPVDLLDGMLIYGNWVYLLPTRFRGDSTIASLGELRQKNFRWRLSRQEMLDKNDVKNESWVTSDFDSPSRMAEMLMFHDAVGGSRYTGLRHGELNQLDLSDLLVSDRCMLVGRLRDPLLDVQLRELHSSGQESSQGSNQANEPIRPTGKVLSMVRIVLPVEVGRAR
jgi:hypothetical protein